MLAGIPKQIRRTIPILFGCLLAACGTAPHPQSSPHLSSQDKLKTKHGAPMSEDRKSPDDHYGSWKFIHEIELEDLQAHPIWLWCTALSLPDEEDGPIG